jgi:hypothetical protein
MTDNVFNHDHGAFDDHSEIQGAKRQQVCRNMLQAEASGGEEQRERHGDGDDDCPAGIPQKQQENDDHQNNAFREVVQDGMGGEVHQVAAVDKGNHLNASGQNVIVHLFDLGVNPAQRLISIGALAQ